MSRFIQIADGLAVPMGIRRMEKDARHRAGEYVGPDIDWQQLSPDVVDNGFVKVFPLARSAGGQEADEKLLALKKRCEMAFIHFFGGDGFHSEIPLSLEEGYGRKLSAAGLLAPPRWAWSVWDQGFTMVHAADPDAEGAATLSLHFYPYEWLWSRPLEYEKWSWSQRNAIKGRIKKEEAKRRKAEKQIEETSIEWRWPADATAIEGNDQ